MNYVERLNEIIKVLEGRGYIFKYQEEIKELHKYKIFGCDFFSAKCGDEIGIFFSSPEVQVPIYFVSKKLYEDETLPKNPFLFTLENLPLNTVHNAVSKANIIIGMFHNIRWEMAYLSGALGRVIDPVGVSKNIHRLIDEFGVSKNIHRLIDELNNHLKSEGFL
jgi:hypothetical protein